jgi:hypothetical protein
MNVTHDLATALDPTLLMAEMGLKPDGWQRDVLRSSAQRLLLLCNRQAGKSTVTAILALHTALYQAPALILLLCPSLRQSQELFKKVLDCYRCVQATVPAALESALRLELTNGSRILSLPGKEETVRGYSGVNLLVVDEAARVPDALYYSIRPMLAVSGGRLVCLSTPFGKRGFFHQAWTAGEGWERVKIVAAECPRISPQFLEEERLALGSWWFQQEYECAFTETVDQIFGAEAVQQAFVDDVQPLFGEE